VLLVDRALSSFATNFSLGEGNIMAHYALIEDGVVTNVIVAEQDFIDTQSGTWVQTSYNTQAGVHTLGGTPLRKNYAGIGYVYDAERDAFYAPEPYPSWSLNEDTCLWDFCWNLVVIKKRF
jgi:hypothetical protein